MWGVGVGDGVGLPDIHLWAASTVLSGTSVLVLSRWGPSDNVSLTVDELDIVWALSIAVTGTVLSTSLVTRVAGLSSIGVHLREVESTVQTARKLGDIDIEGELLVEEVEHLVGLVLVVHKIDTGTDVGGVLTLGDEAEGKGITGSGDTVGSGVVSTIKSAVGSASGWVRAERGVPGVTIVAVGSTGGSVKPAPVGIEDNRVLLGNTATRLGALLGGDLWVGLSGEGTDLLSSGEGGKSQRVESGGLEHFECC